MTDDPSNESRGSQRLELAQLQAWEELGFGMFIHFGMSTFDGLELSLGAQPSALYAPDQLDVDQWISIARDTGMKYAVLTTKHVSGHCLWPSRFTGYNVGTSGNTTDVVEAFVRACEDKGLMPGFYYCSWDNHHKLGSLTPTDTRWEWAFTTEAYREFQWRQIEELLTQYGRIGEVWVDIPKVLPRDYRHRLYNRIAELQPEAIIMMNNGFGDGSIISISDTWPSDIVAIERYLPNSTRGHQPWKEIEGQRYYIPGEVCEPIGREWFYVEGDAPRSDAELLGMYLVTRGRGANLLLDVGPDKHGLIPPRYADALARLRANLDLLGM
jgi:alpha-L-fucosidase